MTTGRALQQHQDLRRALLDLKVLPDQLLEQAQAKVREVRHAAALRQVDSIPTSRLKETAKGLRLDAIERAGYTTVGKVANADERRLTSIPGVGEETARRAIAAARQVVRITEQATVVRFDIDDRPTDQRTLLDLLRRYDTARRAVDESTPMWQWFSQHTHGLPEQIEAASRRRASLEHEARSLRKRVFSRKATKIAAAEALQQTIDAETAAVAQLEQIMAEPAVKSFRAFVAGAAAEASTGRPPGEIWQDYERNAAQLLAILAEVTGAADDPAARGFLPAEIVDKVQAMNLDLTMLKASLRGYQAFGAKYALVQRRTILGDEMGLGKTVEALAALCHLRAMGQDTALVVCPASVVANWRSEIHRHTKLDAHVIHGGNRTGAMRNWYRKGGVAITTFDGLRRIDPTGFPAERVLAMLIVDEAHYVKNRNTKRSQAVADWSRYTERVLFLTGTPMENRVEEFQNLVSYLQPEVATRITPMAGLAGPAVFQAAVAPAYLRRNQIDVLDELPELLLSLDWNEATDADEAAYRHAVEQGSFMAMRQAAYQSAAATGLSTLTHADESAKLARLLDIAEEAAAEGLKLVVFSFFRDVLDTVTRALSLALPGAVFGPLTGSVPPADRQRMVDQLTAYSGGAALVAQIEAGGVGLNIQAASVVVLCEPQWKPTVEAQAIARAHRMGQVRRVQVHRLLLEESVDVRMLAILGAKQQLIDQFVLESAIKNASPDAIDVSDLGSVEQVVDEAQAEAAIIEWERRRMGIKPDPPPPRPATWAPPAPGTAAGS